MKYYRCKCGAREAYGSMPPAQCAKCEECGSNLALSPDTHREPLEHDFSNVQPVKTDQGEMTVTYCRYCHHTREEIAKLTSRSGVGEIAKP